MARFVFLLICQMLALTPASLAGVHVLPRDGGAFVIVNGEITAKDAIELDLVALSYPRAAVLFESPGGNLMAGLRMGETIRRMGYSTGVAPGTRCASACALAWLGGVSRFMSARSIVGFHAAYNPDDGSVNAPANALVGAYAASLGLSRPAILFITSAQPKDMKWLSPEMANGLGIAVTVLEVESTQATPPPAALPPVLHYVTGLDPNGDNWLALKEGPDIRSRRLAKLASGTSLLVEEKRGRWWRVTLADGRKGWVASEYVGCCRAP